MVAPCTLIVVVPYRDRAENLERLVPWLQAHLRECEHRIVVVEQAGEGPFNKGRLLNAGFDLHRAEDAYFCFHDVDLLPENEACDYSYPRRPTHLSKYCSQFGYREPYSWLCGGVMLFDKEDFVRINGYSNEYWGWGAEDDDLAQRLTRHGYAVDHLEGRYTSLPHSSCKSATYPTNVRRLRSRYDFSDDGLSSLSYAVVDRFDEPGYTRYLIEVGDAPRHLLAAWRSRNRARARELFAVGLGRNAVSARIGWLGGTRVARRRM
jgi:hypothetical protein